MTSTLYVDNLIEKTSGNGVHIPGHVIQVAEDVTSTAVTVAVGAGAVAINSINFTPKYSNSIIEITISHAQTTRISAGGTGSWLSVHVQLDGVNTNKIRSGALGYPESHSDQRYTFSVTGQIPSWSGQKTLTHAVTVGSTNSNWIISHQNAPTGMFVREIAQ